MDLEREIENYLSSSKSRTTTSSIIFLIKLWKSPSVKSSGKYDTILSYFTKHLLPQVFNETSDNDCVEETKRFFQLKHAANTVSSTAKEELVESLTSMLSQIPSSNLITSCLELTSNESFKDFFTLNLDIYCDLLASIIKCFNNLVETGEQVDEILLPKIITELYCFAKLENFKELFLKKLLLPLSKATKRSSILSRTASRNLLNSIFFPALAGSSLDIFKQQNLTGDKQMILMEAFITSNSKNSEIILKMLKFMESQACDDDVEFLNQTKKNFLLLKSCEIDLAPFKRQEPELFTKLTLRIQSAVDNSKQSMDFAEFLEVLSAFINCDAFLFEKNIYDVLIDCMLREKSPGEMTNYESLLSIIVKIYGKDLNQFLKKLLKSMDDRLESFTISKKRKRKTTSGTEADVAAKKQRLDVDAAGDDWSHITYIWPKSMSEQFAEIAAGLNFGQSIKVWNQLNSYLASVLTELKDSSTIDENMLFKIDFASNLLCELFNNTRLLEQLMYKQQEITPTAEQFNQTQHLFYEIIVNIEYNSRVMCAFLKLSRNYENFLMLFFYHQNADIKSELEALFSGNQIVDSKWKIIQQRVKNFGKTEEKNHLNSLLIQKQQKNQLLGSVEVGKADDDTASIVSDDKQIEFLMQKANTRSFFVTSLQSKELKSFVQFLTKLDDKNLQLMILETVAQNQNLLDSFIAELVQGVDDSNLKSRLEILSKLPLDSASDESKKKIFAELLNQKCPKDLAVLVVSVVDKTFQNDSYKSVFKDFAIEKVVSAFNVITFSRIYQPILSSAARKLNNDTLSNFNWIVKSDNNKLVQILAQVITEVPLTATGAVTAAAVTTLKTDLISKMMESFAEKTLKKLSEANFNAFMVLVKLCSENSSALKDDIKTSYIALLQKIVKDAAKSPNAERANLLLMTLKDVKKLGLSDEFKEIIVDGLVTYLKSKLAQRISSEAGDDHQNVELEKQLFETLKPFKSNFQEGCLQTLRQTLIKSVNVTKNQLLYSFKIFNIAFQNIDQSSGGAIKNYTKFHDNFVPKVLTFDCADLIIQVLETNNAVLRGSKFQLDNTTIDEMLCLLTDPRAKPSSLSIDEFFKFYSAIGETLFVVANVRQNYFKSRISQYFNVYKNFMEATYYYKNDQPEELSTVEVSWLLKLALQLENIMKMIAKNHSQSIKVTSLYVLSSIVSIFVKNPKTLSVGYKFKVNIKNICYQLLSTFDDKARKHVYSVTDETSREVYDGLFNEIRGGSR